MRDRHTLRGNDCKRTGGAEDSGGSYLYRDAYLTVSRGESYRSGDIHTACHGKSGGKQGRRERGEAGAGGDCSFGVTDRD